MSAGEDVEAVARALLGRAPAPPLAAPALHDPSLSARIDRLATSPAVRGVLHLMNDDVDRAHEIAQANEGTSIFDYIHAVVHRRGGDIPNAKYWLARVERHPVLLAIHRDRVGARAFFDRCGRASADPELELTQWRELCALLDHARSTGGRAPPE